MQFKGGFRSSNPYLCRSFCVKYMTTASFALLLLLNPIAAQANPVAFVSHPLVPTSAAPGSTARILTVHRCGICLRISRHMERRSSIDRVCESFEAPDQNQGCGFVRCFDSLDQRGKSRKVASQCDLLSGCHGAPVSGIHPC